MRAWLYHIGRSPDPFCMRGNSKCGALHGMQIGRGRNGEKLGGGTEGHGVVQRCFPFCSKERRIKGVSGHVRRHGAGNGPEAG